MFRFWCSLWINLFLTVSVQQKLNSLFLRTWETVYSWVVLHCHLSAFIHLSTHTMGNVLNFPFPMMIGSVWVQFSTIYLFVEQFARLNCSSISHDGSLVAGGFSDSSLKVSSALYTSIFFPLSFTWVLIFKHSSTGLGYGKDWATICWL